MNDGMYTNIRNYLEEIASQQRELLTEQKRTNGLLNDIRLASNRTDDRLREMVGKMQPPMFELPEGTTIEDLLGQRPREIVFVPKGTNIPRPPDAVGPVTVEAAQTVDSRVKGATSEFVTGTKPKTEPVEGLAAMGTMTVPKPETKKGKQP